MASGQGKQSTTVFPNEQTGPEKSTLTLSDAAAAGGHCPSLANRSAAVRMSIRSLPMTSAWRFTKSAQVFEAKADLLHLQVRPARARDADLIAHKHHEHGQMPKAEHFGVRLVLQAANGGRSRADCGLRQTRAARLRCSTIKPPLRLRII